jgi:hypothetical protein
MVALMAFLQNFFNLWRCFLSQVNCFPYFLHNVGLLLSRPFALVIIYVFFELIFDGGSFHDDGHDDGLLGSGWCS